MTEPTRPEQLNISSKELSVSDAQSIFDFFQEVSVEHLGRTYRHLKTLFTSTEKVKEYFVWLRENGAKFLGFFDGKKMIGGAILVKSDLPKFFKPGLSVAGITHQNYNRIGLSKKVFIWAKDVLKDSKETNLYASTLLDNFPAQQALEIQGFKKAGIVDGEIWYQFRQE